jgi:hypothetical protein
MASGEGFTDTDKGMAEIRKQIEALGNFAVKAGVTDGAVAQYASWNELGVKGPPLSQHGGGVWFIPPRPFIRGWLADKESSIKTTIDKVYKLVADGKMDAKTAASTLGQFAQDGIKNHLMSGDFTQNADRTIQIKGSSKPLMDTGTLRNSIRFEVIGKGDKVEGPVLS